VTEKRVMGLAAHFACVRVIATTLASLPIHVYERMPDGSKRPAPDHPVQRLFRNAPNPWMSSMSLIEAMQAQIVNRGAAFAEIVFNRNGQIIEIWPIPPGQCEPFRDDKTGKLKYRIDGTHILPAWKVLHVPGLAFDGISSLSPVGLFMQTYGLSLAVEEFGSRFFGQGTNIGGFMEYPGKLGDEAYSRLKTEMDAKYKGLQKSFSVIILEGGMKYSPVGMKMEEAQFIESRKFTVTEMARIHGIPPHLIGDLEKATYSNIEEQGIEAVTYLFRPSVVRWEQAINRRLFSEEEQDRYYVKFELDSLLRGNSVNQAQYFTTLRNAGVLSANEIRELLDMNPRTDSGGGEYLTPMNMAGSNAGRE
jgi:HK97 family phage portal protein